MTEPKTRPTTASVHDFINATADTQKITDSLVLLEIMKKITGEDAVMWGPGIVGFDHYTYKYADGKELTWPIVGFSPRKQYLTVYLMNDFTNTEGELLAKLGKHKTSKACLYLKKLSDININVLTELIERSVTITRQKHTKTV